MPTRKPGAASTPTSDDAVLAKPFQILGTDTAQRARQSIGVLAE